MAITKEIGTVREKVTAYISTIHRLESELDKANKETALAKKAFDDAKSENESLKKEIKGVISEKETLEEAVKQFKQLGEKDKKEIVKLKAQIDALKKDNSE